MPTRSEATGVVSLWAGRFSSEEEFFSYVEITYTKSGATSGFIRESGIGVYDEDFAEGDYCHDRNVELAILNFSYAGSFSSLAIAATSRIVDVNSIYAIYDVDASGLKSDTDKLVFVGVFMYSK